jgi:hypothetical protein
MVVGFTSTYAINAYHHWCSNLDQVEVYNIVIKFASDLRQVDGFLRVLRFVSDLR